MIEALIVSSKNCWPNSELEIHCKNHLQFFFWKAGCLHTINFIEAYYKIKAQGAFSQDVYFDCNDASNFWKLSYSI